MAPDSCGHKHDGRISYRKFYVDNLEIPGNMENNRKVMCNCVNGSFTNGLYSCKYTKLLQILIAILVFSNLKFTSATFNEDIYENKNSFHTDKYENPGEGSFNSYDSDDEMNTCIHGKYLKGYTLEGGTKAGKYVNLGVVQSFDECVELCCQEITCKIAIMLTSPKTKNNNCFKIECNDPESDLCKVKSAHHSRYHPHLFQRGEIKHTQRKVATSEGSTHSIITNETVLNKDLPSLTRVKRVKSMCHEYTGSVCSGMIDKSKIYFYTSSNDSALDKRLQGPIEQISSHLSGACRNIALQAICYRFYPQCDDPSQPKPIHVCESECDKLTYGECAADFVAANMLTYLQHVIPGCGKTDSIKKRGELDSCVKLQAEIFSQTTRTPPSNSKNVLKTQNASSSLYTNYQHQYPSTTYKPYPVLATNTILSSVSSPNQHIKKKMQNVSNASVSATYNKSSTNSSDVSGDGSVYNGPLVTLGTTSTTAKTDEKPVLVDVDSNNNEETSYEEVSADKKKILTTDTPPVHMPTTDDKIRVSAGDNTEILLPTNQVSLYASTWPKENHDGDYSYKWAQMNAPKNSHGYIEGKTSKNVKLTQLDVPGLYEFALNVKSKSGKEGVGFVNITVKEPSRVNHPPRAEVSPKEQTIQLPTNTVILDGSKSSDDDKIVSYKWEELKGPIEQSTVFGSDTDSKILQLRNLVAGEYRFKLIVEDSDGETDSMEAVVVVKEEQDFPPKANAGQDIMIRLPSNSVELNGNKSTDDKGGLKYSWSKTADSPRCDMIGTDQEMLKISSLVEGTYVFTLRVTDSNEQSDEAQVKVVVLPEINTKPVAIAGDDKELKYPDTSTTLDGSASTDNSKITSYQWEKLSGPAKIKMIGADSAKVHISELAVGTYVFRLTVTDDKNLVGTDTVQIKVKKDHNEPPTAVIKERVRTIRLPTHTAVIDASESTDDELIVSFLWTRAGSSPAAGDIINGSDHSSILRLANLVRGKYIFDLTVTDEKGATGQASTIITVEEDENKMHLVQMYLDIDIKKFTEESKKQLIRKISVVLEVDRKLVKVIEIASVHYKRGVMVKFIVEDPNIPNRKFDGKYISDLLKHKIGNGGKLFDFTMLRVEPYVCRNNCSNHGYCDDITKVCVCDTFWMGNFFKSHMGAKESNCDWSILYLSVAVFAIFLLFLGLTWSICYLLARRKRSRRRARYRALRSTDPDDADDEILLIPKAMKEKFTANSLTFTESDEDSEEETTVFDKNRVPKGRPNGNANGKLKYRDRAM